MTRFGRLRRSRYSLGVVLLGVIGLVAAGGATGARSTSTTLATFKVHGTYAWTVPAGITKVGFDVFGASGGNTANGLVLIAVGGAGGEAKAHFTVKAGQTFEVVVGGRGGDGDTTTTGAGGFDGGGAGSSPGTAGFVNGAGGGGGSDVRIGGSGNACVATLACGFGDRIVVGGGGGGAGGGSDFVAPSPGGGGGGLTGADAVPDSYGSGGTQEGGGVCQPFVTPVADQGSFGQGAYAAPVVFGSHIGGGGGGGGWYGGGGGCWGSGGGGGSGLIGPFAKSGTYPGGTHAGDGLVVIRTP